MKYIGNQMKAESKEKVVNSATGSYPRKSTIRGESNISKDFGIQNNAPILGNYLPLC